MNIDDISEIEHYCTNVLGLPLTVSKNEIIKRIKVLKIKHHPDKCILPEQKERANQISQDVGMAENKLNAFFDNMNYNSINDYLKDNPNSLKKGQPKSIYYELYLLTGFVLFATAVHFFISYYAALDITISYISPETTYSPLWDYSISVASLFYNGILEINDPLYNIIFTVVISKITYLICNIWEKYEEDKALNSEIWFTISYSIVSLAALYLLFSASNYILPGIGSFLDQTVFKKYCLEDYTQYYLVSANFVFSEIRKHSAQTLTLLSSLLIIIPADYEICQEIYNAPSKAFKQATQVVNQFYSWYYPSKSTELVEANILY